MFLLSQLLLTVELLPSKIIQIQSVWNSSALKLKVQSVFLLSQLLFIYWQLNCCHLKWYKSSQLRTLRQWNSSQGLTLVQCFGRHNYYWPPRRKCQGQSQQHTLASAIYKRRHAPQPTQPISSTLCPRPLCVRKTPLSKTGSYEPIMICWDFVQVLQKELSAAMGETFQYLNCSVLLAYWSTLTQTLSIRLLKLQCVNSKKSRKMCQLYWVTHLSIKCVTKTCTSLSFNIQWNNGNQDSLGCLFLMFNN